MSATATAATAAGQTENLATRFVVKATSVLRGIKDSRPVSWIAGKFSALKGFLRNNRVTAFLYKERLATTGRGANMGIRSWTIVGELKGFLKLNAILAPIFWALEKLGQGLENALPIRTQFKMAFGDWRNLHRRVVSWAWEIAMHFVNFIYLTAAVYVGVYLLIPAVLFVAAADTWEMFRGGALNKETSWTYFLMTILYKVYIGMQYRINGYKPGWLMRFRAPAYTTGAVRHFVRIVKALIDESERLEKDVEKIYNDSDRKSLIAAIHMVQVDLHEAMDYLREVGVSTQLGHKIQKIGNLLTRTQSQVAETLTQQEAEDAQTERETVFDSEETFSEEKTKENPRVKEIEFDNIAIEANPLEMGIDLRQQAEELSQQSRTKFRKFLARNLRRHGHTQDTITKVIAAYDKEDGRIRKERQRASSRV